MDKSKGWEQKEEKRKSQKETFKSELQIELKRKLEGLGIRGLLVEVQKNSTF